MADREFIAAKDLPVTEAKEVNVLVVDPATGELAQKAGANLGGSGGVIELDVEFIPFDEVTSTDEHYRFTNIEQIQTAVDKNMSLHIVTTSINSGRPVVKKYTYSCLKDTLVIGDNSGMPFAYRFADYEYDTGYGQKRIELSIDKSEYVNNGVVKITSFDLEYLSSMETLVKAYASLI